MGQVGGLRQEWGCRDGVWGWDARIGSGSGGVEMEARGAVAKN